MICFQHFYGFLCFVKLQISDFDSAPIIQLHYQEKKVPLHKLDAVT